MQIHIHAVLPVRPIVLLPGLALVEAHPSGDLSKSKAHGALIA